MTPCDATVTVTQGERTWTFPCAIAGPHNVHEAAFDGDAAFSRICWIGHEGTAGLEMWTR